MQTAGSLRRYGNAIGNGILYNKQSENREAESARNVWLVYFIMNAICVGYKGVLKEVKEDGKGEGSEWRRGTNCQQLHPRCAPGVHCVPYAITPLLRSRVRLPAMVVVRLGVLALLLLPALLLLLLMLLLLLRLLHPFPLPVQFVFCSICVFTLSFNAQKLRFAWLPPRALPSPPTLLLLPGRVEGRKGRGTAAAAACAQLPADNRCR